jgi:C1A family cysteine protease
MKKGLLVVLALCVLCVGPSLAHGQQVMLSQIQQAINAQGAKWEAGATSMTALSPDQQRMRLGSLPSPNRGKGKVTAAMTAAYALPPSIDWRNNGGNFVSYVKNQGNCGSCWAFAATAALESYTMIKNKQPNTNIDLSEQVTLSCSGAGNCEAGGYPDGASDFFISTGLPVESCFPYSGVDGTCTSACANWKPTAYKLNSYSWVVSSGAQPMIDAVKSALNDHGPLIMTMHVYNDFFSYRSGVYTHVSGSWAGDHAILAVGYDDANKCLVVKNSWGSGWGESGFFRIAYSEIEGDSKFGYETLAYEGNDPPPPPPTCDYVSSRLFGNAGGTGAIAVTPADGCAWTATGSASWISITSGGSGTGSGVIQYTVAPLNDTNTSRTGSITVQGKTYPITQSATATLSAGATRR